MDTYKLYSSVGLSIPGLGREYAISCEVSSKPIFTSNPYHLHSPPPLVSITQIISENSLNRNKARVDLLMDKNYYRCKFFFDNKIWTQLKRRDMKPNTTRILILINLSLSMLFSFVGYLIGIAIPCCRFNGQKSKAIIEFYRQKGHQTPPRHSFSFPHC